MTIIFTIKPTLAGEPRRRWHWSAVARSRPVARSASAFTRRWSAERSLDRFIRRIVAGDYRRAVRSGRGRPWWAIVGDGTRDIAHSWQWYANAGAAGRSARAFIDALAAGRYVIDTGGRPRYGEARG